MPLKLYFVNNVGGFTDLVVSKFSIYSLSVTSVGSSHHAEGVLKYDPAC